jgi:hypothetical protein
VGNAKMLPCRRTNKPKSNNGAGFIEGRFRGAKYCIRTAREKTLPFPPITVELASILRCIRSHQGLGGGRLNTGFACFGCGKRNTLLNPIAITSWSDRDRFFGKTTSEAFVLSSPILDAPTRRAKKGPCL